jgi:hypothetical protein
LLELGLVGTTYTTKATLVANQYYKFKVDYRNAYGYSLTTSNVVTILAASVPTPPLNLVNRPEITAAGVVGLSWTTPQYDGGSPLIDYSILYRISGSGSFTVLTSGVIVT